MQIGFYFDQSRCSGCFTCSVACKDWHDIPAGPVARTSVGTTETGRFPNVAVTFFRNHCYHCAEPVCAPACPAGAIAKLPESGIVAVDRDACLGRDGCGGSCLEACPYDIPQFEAGPDKKMDKCDFCLDRWQAGQKPVCVEACPMRALDAGPLVELERKYGEKAKGEKGPVGFTYHGGVKPAIVIKPKG